MKKTTPRPSLIRLRLDRTTVRRLDDPRLGAAAGGRPPPEPEPQASFAGCEPPDMKEA